MSTLKPLLQYNRDISLDVLRGFALAGVLFMFCVNDIGAPAKYANSFLDDLIAWPKWILIEGRMYTMLVLIFGIGFHVQLKKAKQYDTLLAPVFFAAADWANGHRFYSCHLTKQPGHINVLWSCRVRVAAG